MKVWFFGETLTSYPDKAIKELVTSRPNSGAPKRFRSFRINRGGRLSLLVLCDERSAADRTLKCQGSRVVCHHVRQVLRPNAIKGIGDR